MEARLLSLEDFPAYLQTLSKKDWQPLLDLIPEIESTQKFDHFEGIKKSENGDFEMPHLIPAPALWKFRETFINLGLLISFDWSSWDEGRRIANAGVDEIKKQDLLTICMLLTAIIRNDRFCEGALTTFFEDGNGLAALKRIEEIVDEK